MHNHRITTYFYIFLLPVFFAVPAKAYHIDISVKGKANLPVFLAGYYGESVAVIDSAQLDHSGKAFFANSNDLCTGIYTIVIPGALTYDILIDGTQQLDITWNADNDAAVSGDSRSSAYAGYLAWLDTKPEKQQIAKRREQLIAQYPNTFLARYMKALQPVEQATQTDDIGQMMNAYHYRRRHFFDNMNLSDADLLRTPLYHETVHYYISKFVTQHADTLIHIAYRLLEQASGNYETFFYMSDLLVDYSLRSKIENINRLYNFLRRNRVMLSSKAVAMLPARSGSNYFLLQDDADLQNTLTGMAFSETDGSTFDPKQIKSKYKIFYFWHQECPRCLTEASKWQALLNKFHSKSCFGIAVNIKGDVRQPENRILAYEPLCINISLNNMPECRSAFFADAYSKIIVTDTDGKIIGIFPSSAALDEFLSKI